MSTNDITGDSLRTKPASNEYRNNFDAIDFSAHRQVEGWTQIDKEPMEWPEDESRIDIVGQNGNDGLVYEVLEKYK